MLDVAHPRPDVRARGRADLGDEPAVLRRHPGVEPGRAGAVHPRAGAGARPPRAVEAAPGAAPDSGGARQHQGAAGHLRQGRHRDDARRAEVHRRRSAARVLERRRPAPARRSRRRADRSVAGRRRLHRVPRDRGRAAGPRVVPPRPREVRAEAAARRGPRAARRPAAGHRHARAEGDAGGVQDAGRPDERRRSAARPGRSTKAEHPAPGELGRRRRASSSTSSRRSSSARRSSRVPAGEPITVAPTPEFYRWSFASMWTPGPVREQADARLLLPDRRRSVVAGRAAGRAPARLQLPDALVDLDSRGLSRATSCTTSTCGASSRRCASRSCSRRRRSSKAGRTTASR